MTKIDLSKIDAPWRKVSERPMPKDGQKFAVLWTSPRDVSGAVAYWDAKRGLFCTTWEAESWAETDPVQPDLWMPLPEAHR